MGAGVFGKSRPSRGGSPRRGLPFFLALFFLALGCDEGSAPKLRPTPNQIVEKLDDRIEISLNAKVDIIVVMDGSGSMSTHQANLKQNIGAFVQELTKASYLDYRIAVTIAGCRRAAGHSQYSSDLCNEGLFHRASSAEKEPYFIRRGDPDEDVLLRSRLEVGTANDSRESFFSPVIKAITAPLNQHPANRGFLRSQAYLIPIFVTDTDDQSDLYDARQFYDNLIRIKGSSDLIIPYGAIIPSGFRRVGCSRDPVNNTPGEPVRIEEFLRTAGGSHFNLCGGSFGADLVQVAQDLVSRVEPVIYLEDRPYVPSIRLYYGGEEIPNDFEKGWVYDPQRNIIKLGQWLDLQGKRNLAFQISYVKANRF